MATITVKGIESLTHRLNNIAKTEKVKETMEQAVKMVHAQAKLLAPVNQFGGGGNLAGSIRPKVITAGDIIIGKVFTNVEYAPYVEFGTGIKGNGTYPNKDIKLSYRPTGWVYTPNDGEDFFYTKGQVAQPFLYPAVKQNEKKIKAMFKEALNDDIKRNSKGG